MYFDLPTYFFCDLYSWIKKSSWYGLTGVCPVFQVSSLTRLQGADKCDLGMRLALYWVHLATGSTWLCLPSGISFPMALHITFMPSLVSPLKMKGRESVVTFVGKSCRVPPHCCGSTNQVAEETTCRCTCDILSTQQSNSKWTYKRRLHLEGWWKTVFGCVEGAQVQVQSSL